MKASFPHLTRQGISSNLQKELLAYCAQYPEWVQQVNRASLNAQPDPQSLAAAERIRMLESLSQEIAGDDWRLLLDDVSHKRSLRHAWELGMITRPYRVVFRWRRQLIRRLAERLGRI